MRKVVLILVAVILLLAGGGAAWWFLMGPGAEKTNEIIAQIKKPEPVYLPINPPLVITLIQENEVTHHVTMQLNMLLADKHDLDETNRKMPLLRDALLTELHGLFALRLVRNAGFESGMVKERLMLVCDRELGKGVVSDVLVRVLEQRAPQQS